MFLRKDCPHKHTNAAKVNSQGWIRVSCMLKHRLPCSGTNQTTGPTFPVDTHMCTKRWTRMARGGLSTICCFWEMFGSFKWGRWGKSLNMVNTRLDTDSVPEYLYVWKTAWWSETLLGTLSLFLLPDEDAVKHSVGGFLWFVERIKEYSNKNIVIKKSELLFF